MCFYFFPFDLVMAPNVVHLLRETKKDVWRIEIKRS